MSSTGAEKRVGFACSFSPVTESSLNKYEANEGTHDSWTERTEAQSFVWFVPLTPSRGRKRPLCREEALSPGETCVLAVSCLSPCPRKGFCLHAPDVSGRILLTYVDLLTRFHLRGLLTLREFTYVVARKVRKTCADKTPRENHPAQPRHTHM